uniref:Trypsin-14 n=1 Tax=Nilaparvata lugens TaxID=108931 RepID=A0A068F5B9_NILLU|nr:trypsin-14 [Nilaparvata lugens]
MLQKATMSFINLLPALFSLPFLLVSGQLQRPSGSNLTIINGQPVAEGEIKYQIALIREGKFHCGGSIIGPETILTAAHCVYGDEERPDLFTVRYGTIHRESSSNEVQVIEIIRHEKYNDKTVNFDVALLKIARAITPSSSVDFVGLATELPAATDSLLLSGWGRNERGRFPERLQKAETLKFIDNSSCEKSWNPGGEETVITKNMLCAISSQQSGCNGDSGGPLVNRRTGKLVGIVSFGEQYCRVGSLPNVYASVPELRAWITGNSRRKRLAKSFRSFYFSLKYSSY